MEREQVPSTPSPAPNRAEDDESAGDRTQRPWMQFAGLGMELSGTTLGLAGIGYLVDSARGHQTLYATATGVLVGFAFGMFRFIQKAARATGDPPKRDNEP